MLLQSLPLGFGSTRFTVWEEMSVEDFQDGRHSSDLGYRNEMILASLNLHVAPMPLTKFGLAYLGKRNGMILAILNLYVAPMLFIKFQLNPTYGLGGDVLRKISRWLPSWILERNDLAVLNLCVPSTFGSV